MGLKFSRWTSSSRCGPQVLVVGLKFSLWASSSRCGPQVLEVGLESRGGHCWVCFDFQLFHGFHSPQICNIVAIVLRCSKLYIAPLDMFKCVCYCVVHHVLVSVSVSVVLLVFRSNLEISRIFKKKIPFLKTIFFFNRINT